MNATTKYAIDMICDGAESTVEDDLNEDGKIGDDEHTVAVGIAMAMIRVMRNDPEAFFEWAATHRLVENIET